MRLLRSSKRIVLAVLLAPALLTADVIYSPTSTNDSGPGTLRQAILDGNGVATNLQVYIDLSLLQTFAAPNQAFVNLTTGAVPINRPMFIYGNAGAPPVVVRNPTQNSRLVEIAGNVNGLIQIADIVFESGAALTHPNYQGGAIRYQQSGASTVLELLIQRCGFKGNVAGIGNTSLSGTNTRGGAVYFGGSGSPSSLPVIRIEDTYFLSNSLLGSSTTPADPILANGAAISTSLCITRIERTTFDNHSGNNSAATGGVVELQAPAPSSYLRSCTFNENTVGLGTSTLRVVPIGTAVLDVGLDVESCLFYGNGSFQADAPIIVGGGANATANVNFTNCTIIENRGSNQGAILVSSNATVKLTNCTINRNIHNQSNGAAVVVGQPTSNVEIARTVIAGNNWLPLTTAPGFSPDIRLANGVLTSAGYNFIGTIEGVPGVFNQAGDVVGASNANRIDPLLAMLADYGGPTRTSPPRPDSPLVDAIAVPVSGLIPTDARGISRPQGNFADIGAVELPRTPYSTWNLQLPANLRAAALDGDADGLENRMEYFLGSDPDSFTGQPVRFIEAINGKFIEFDRWTQVRPAYFTDWRAEYSTDLQTWLPITAVTSVQPVVPGSIDYMRYRMPFPTSATPVFFRLSVRSPN